MAGKLLFGYDATNKVWIPLQVDANGLVKVDMSAVNLDDLGDVSVATPTDGYVLYWDAATSLWKCKAVGDVVGPSSSVINSIPIFADETGKLLKTSVCSISVGGYLYANRFLVAGTNFRIYQQPTMEGNQLAFVDPVSGIKTLSELVPGNNPPQVHGNEAHDPDFAAVLDDLADVEVPTPTDGFIIYWDAATSLWKCKAAPGMAVHGNEYHDPDFASTFLQLTDTPSSYSGKANQLLRVNPAGNSLEFIARGWQLVADQYFAATADSYTISGLNGDAALIYMIFVHHVSVAGVANDSILLRLNNDATSGNYPSQYLYIGGTTVSAAYYTALTGFYTSYVPGTTAGNLSWNPAMFLHARTGCRRSIHAYRHHQSTILDAYRWASSIGEWANTADNITSMVFKSLVGNGIGAGSRITVFKVGS